jgi:DNA polymerase (family 10)
MGANADLAAIIDRMADMMELLGANRFRVNAHRRAARAIRDQAVDLVTLADEPAELQKIEGIGKGIAEKIGEFAGSGAVAEHDELAARVPGGLMALLELPGVGPKKVKAMWEELGVEGLEDLTRVIDDGSLAELKGMGKKTVENIRDSIEFASRQTGRTRVGIALPVAEALIERLRSVGGVEAIEYAGSMRRGREDVGDIDLLVVAEDGARVREAFVGTPGVERVLANGERKASVRLGVDGRVIQVDLRLVPASSLGAALMYFTGSKEHNVRLRERALKRGLTLNEYGLFPEDPETDEPPQARGVEPVASGTEEAVYAELGLPWIPPELREDRGEVSDGYEPPELIRVEDIVSELHAHTTASDGKMSIEELARAAKARGFHTIAVTDHSVSSVIANGLRPERLREHMEAVRSASVRGIRILAGSEVDILADGRLDYDDELLAEMDVVVASPHASLKQGAAAATSRLLRAIEHPLVHIIGHPTGRLIGKRGGLEPAMDELVAAAAEHGTALEINANSLRLDLRDTHVRAALEAGVDIAINCDVHRVEHFDQLRYGVLTARRGGLTADRCVNAWSRARLDRWLRAKRGG